MTNRPANSSRLVASVECESRNRTYDDRLTLHYFQRQLRRVSFRAWRRYDRRLSSSTEERENDDARDLFKLERAEEGTGTRVLFLRNHLPL